MSHRSSVETMSVDRSTRKLMSFIRDEEGLAMIEYGLIAALIGSALIITLVLLTSTIQDMFNRVISTLTNA